MARMSRRRTINAILELGADVCNAAKKALAEGADAVVEDAKSRVPVRTGKLRDSIHAVPNHDGTRIKVVADAKNDAGTPYGQYVEFWPGREHPFLYPALNAKYPEIRRNIIEAIREAVRAHGKSEA